MDWEKSILEKPFASLTHEEKALLGPEIDAVSFRQLQITWQETSRFLLAESDQLPRPRPEIRMEVRAHMRNLPMPGMAGRLKKLFAYRIPAYQAVAAAIVFLGIIHFGSNSLPFGNQGYGAGTTVIVDSTRQDSAQKTGVNLYEDSVFSQFLIESL